MQKTRNYISYDQDNTLQTSFGPCSFEVKRKMPWSDILLPRRAWWHIHRWQGFNLLSEQRERNPLMLMRKHLIEQRGAASLKHSLDPKLCMQDPARPVGPADRVQRGSCWDYKRRWTGTNLLLRGDPVTIHVPWRGLCDSWQISTFIPTVLKETSKWFTSTESQSDVGEKRSLSLTINPALLNPPLNHVPKCHLSDLWKGRQGRNKVVSKKSVYQNLLIKKLHFHQRGKKSIHRKVFPQFLNHFLNKEASLSKKLLLFIQHFSHLAFLIDLENDAHNLNIYLRHKANTCPCERRILHLPLTLHHGAGHCIHNLLTSRLFFLFDPNTWERKTNYRFCGMFLPHYSRLHVWLLLGENPL